MPCQRWPSRFARHRYSVLSPEADELRLRGQLDGTIAPIRHHHSTSELWPIPKSDTETDLPPSPYPSEIGEPADGYESAKASDTEDEYPRQLSRRHTLPSIDDHSRPRLCPLLSAKSTPQTYTAVTFHTPDAVFTKGSSDPCFARSSSTHSTIVCGEKNWMAHVD